jgi:hypothetical protein
MTNNTSVKFKLWNDLTETQSENINGGYYYGGYYSYKKAYQSNAAAVIVDNSYSFKPYTSVNVNQSNYA